MCKAKQLMVVALGFTHASEFHLKITNVCVHCICDCELLGCLHVNFKIHGAFQKPLI